MRLNGGLFIHGLTLQYPLSFCKYKRKYTHMPGLRVKDGRPLLFDLALAAARSDHEAPFGIGCSRRDIDAVLPAIGQGHPAARTGVARIFLEAGFSLVTCIAFTDSELMYRIWSTTQPSALVR